MWKLLRDRFPYTNLSMLAIIFKMLLERFEGYNIVYNSLILNTEYTYLTYFGVENLNMNEYEGSQTYIYNSQTSASIVRQRSSHQNKPKLQCQKTQKQSVHKTTTQSQFLKTTSLTVFPLRLLCIYSSQNSEEINKFRPNIVIILVLKHSCLINIISSLALYVFFISIVCTNY